MITNLYLLVEAKRFNFANALSPLVSKTEKTLPNYSQIQKTKKPSFFSLTKIFKTKTNPTSLKGPSVKI